MTWNRRVVALVLALSLGFAPLVHGSTAPGLDLSSFEIFQMVYEQSVRLQGREIPVLGTNRSIPVTFGAEKEGSSSKIVRVMSPSKFNLGNFLRIFANRSFANKFLSEFMNGRHRVRNVVDAQGNQVNLISPDPSLIGFDWVGASDKDYNDAVTKFLNQFPRSPFSFIDMKTRVAIFREDTGRWMKDYEKWEPLIGISESYIDEGHTEQNKGWEVIFKPQRTYADFEKQQLWFRKIMGDRDGTLYEAPGHQRVVMPKVQLLPKEKAEYVEHVGEVSRMIQAYVVLRGIKGNTGLLGARHKMMYMDELFQTLDHRWERGPIRMEEDRFYPNSVDIEYRVGMKDEVVRRFVQAIYTARLASNDFSGIAKVSDYALNLPSKELSSIRIAARFDVDYDVATKAIENFTSVKKATDRSRALELSYMLPIWGWENAPFLQGKKDDLMRISREYLERVAALENPSYYQIANELRKWVIASDLTRDIEKYLTPKAPIDTKTSPLLVDIKPGDVDVNQIDMGNEFTARMPLRLAAETNYSGNWISTVYDMTPASREAKIRSVAESVKEKLTGSRAGVVQLNQDSHGHDLGVAFSFEDSQNRTWRVEWDGIGRNYDEDGNVVEGSARGGHIEIVSPKYNPQMEEIIAVYEAMDAEGVIPEYKMGGSHINVDFTIFEQRPEALARFLTLWHQNRGIIAFMFQHVNRLRSAEPVEVTPQLDQALRHFHGTKERLAALLYNNHYFNQRFSRKTRYTQWDLSNYMASVIPEAFIEPDFDVVRARAMGGVGWTRQFRVTPATKMEGRFADAPADPLEAALQMKLVRALLNKALNDNSPLTRPVQSVNYEAYIANPNLLYTHLQELANEVNLNPADYMPYINNKYAINKAYMASSFYENWISVADREHPKVKDWGRAVSPARPENQLIYSDRAKPAVNTHPRCDVAI